MSHVYQPVVIQHLLASNGIANTPELAKSLLSYDSS